MESTNSLGDGLEDRRTRGGIARRSLSSCTDCAISSAISSSSGGGHLSAESGKEREENDEEEDDSGEEEVGSESSFNLLSSRRSRSHAPHSFG